MLNNQTNTTMENSIKKVKEAALKMFEEGSNWNAVNSLLAKSGLTISEEILEFGLHTNKKSIAAKEDAINNAGRFELIAHYHSVGIKSKSFSYNVIRAKKVTFLL